MKAMPWILIMFWSSGLACQEGTEVGNGVATDESTSADKAGGAQTNTEASMPDAIPEGLYGIPKVLFADCASPFAEAQNASFVNGQDKLAFSLVNASNSEIRLSSWLESGELLIQRQLGQNLQIQTALSPTAYRCSAITTEELSASLVSRTVVIDQQWIVSWKREGQNLVEISLSTSQANVVVYRVK